ncbi:MAG: STAS domain-containing protein [Magnetococcales bacterium]|nr:STAS domain-containing protein [Magnetococcales bacterium]
MAMTVNQNGQDIRIELPDRFVFTLHNDFRHTYESYLAPRPGRKFVIDFAKTSYMDSAALGMLLVMREAVGGDTVPIHLVNARPAVRKILEAAFFHELFKLV